jgi:anti-anti-sigma regulatory factor
MVEIAPGWVADVDRGPDWLFVKLRGPDVLAGEGASLAEALWSMLAEHFIYRLVLELDDVELRSQLLGQLVALHKRIHNQGGLMRLCGLSDINQQVLRAGRLETRFPNYRNREEAVHGHRPVQPR